VTDLATTTATRDEAERLTERIRLTATNLIEAKDKLEALLREAQEREVHAALGFASWTAYLAATFADQPMVLPTAERREIVGLLAAEGMSTRAIAPIVGASKSAVDRDRQVSRTGTPTPRHVDTTTGEITETAGAGEAPTRAGFTEDTSPAPATVTGLDGKTYTRPAPKPRAVPDVPAEYANPEPSYMTRFFEALAADGKALRFDPERVGREATEVEWPSVVAMRRYAEWVDRAERARKGLRVIKGSAR